MAKAKTNCERKSAARKSQAKYVAKNPDKHKAAVKKSQAKSSTKSTNGSKSPGAGKHGKTLGRPRTSC